MLFRSEEDFLQGIGGTVKRLDQQLIEEKVALGPGAGHLAVCKLPREDQEWPQ